MWEGSDGCAAVDGNDPRSYSPCNTGGDTREACEALTPFNNGLKVCVWETVPTKDSTCIEIADTVPACDDDVLVCANGDSHVRDPKHNCDMPACDCRDYIFAADSEASCNTDPLCEWSVSMQPVSYLHLSLSLQLSFHFCIRTNLRYKMHTFPCAQCVARAAGS